MGYFVVCFPAIIPIIDHYRSFSLMNRIVTSFFTIFASALCLMTTSLDAKRQQLKKAEQQVDGLIKTIKHSHNQKAEQKSTELTARAVPRHAIVVSELNLYKLLYAASKNIDEVVKDSLVKQDDSGDQSKAFLIALDLVNEAMQLMEQVVAAINKQAFSFNPDIEYHFLKVCNYPKDVDMEDLAPRHIRDVRQRVKKFNQYVTLYCINHKNFLGEEDLALFNKILRFNHILLLCILREDYFDISILSLLMDTIVFQPWEFICKHPYLVMTVVAIIIAAVIYFYVYPRWFSLRNLNKEYDVMQVEGARQNDGSSCGYYGLLHALINRNAKNEEERQQLLERIKNNPDVIKPWRDHMDAIRAEFMEVGIPSDRKDPFESINLLDSYQIAAIRDDHALVNKVMQPLLGRPADVSNVVVVDTFAGDGVYNKKTEKMMNVHNNQKEQIIRDSVQNLQEESIPQHVVLRIPGHWIAVSVESDDNKRHGIQARIINSTRGNVTNNSKVSRLLQEYQPK